MEDLICLIIFALWAYELWIEDDEDDDDDGGILVEDEYLSKKLKITQNGYD